MNFNDYDLQTDESIIIGACQRIQQAASRPEDQQVILSYFTNLLNLKQQKRILDEQNKFNTRLLNSNKCLVYATWALAVITAILAIVTWKVPAN